MNDENAIYKNILTGNSNDKYKKKLNSHNDNSLMKFVKYVYGGISLVFIKEKEISIISMSRRRDEK